MSRAEVHFSCLTVCGGMSRFGQFSWRRGHVLKGDCAVKLILHLNPEPFIRIGH